MNRPDPQWKQEYTTDLYDMLFREVYASKEERERNALKHRLSLNKNVLVIDGSCEIIGSRVRAQSGFPSVRGNFNLTSGKWYYEALLHTAGCMQIGFASSGFECNAQQQSGATGIGDDEHSWAYDGYRQKRWNAIVNLLDSQSYGAKWKSGDVVGCSIDIGWGTITFYLNGKNLGTAFKSIQFNGNVYPAASLQGSGKNLNQSITFVFDSKDLKYTPDGYNAIIQTIGSETAQYDEKQQQNCKECMIYEQELRKANQTIKLLKSQVFKLQEEQKENELTIIEMEKEIKTLKVRDISNYKQWKHADILLWILSIKDVNGNKIFKKYEDKLSKELANNELTGMDLVSIEKSDIKDLGINVFKDRNLLYQKIKLMIKKNNKKPNMNNDHISNNNMMNEGSNAPTAYM
eukprot:52273_1